MRMNPIIENDPGGEVWKDMAIYNARYQLEKKGAVRNKNTKKIIHTVNVKRPYVVLYYGGNQKKAYIEDLLRMYFDVVPDNDVKKEKKDLRMVLKLFLLLKLKQKLVP
jgi:hypothetical protein